MSVKSLQPFEILATASGLTTASTAYTAGDMLGSELTLANAAAVVGDGGFITSIQVEDHSKIVGALDLRFFNAASTPAADNAANSWSDANARLQVVGQPVAAPTVSALNAIGYTGGLMLKYKCDPASSSLFLNVITLAGHTFFGGAADLQYTIGLLRWE